MENRHSELLGRKMGKLTVEGHIKNGKRGTNYTCECECGNITQASYSQLIHKKKLSCGCLKTGRKLKSDRKSILLRRLFKTKITQSGWPFDEKLNNLIFFEFIITQPCFYCGSLPNKIARDISKTGELLSNTIIIHHGIDRIDSSIGYEVDNIVPCCKLCNSGKETMDIYKFIEHVSSIRMDFLV